MTITTRSLIAARVRRAEERGDKSRLLFVRSSAGDDIRTALEWSEQLAWEREHVASTLPDSPDRLCEERRIRHWQEITREGVLVGERQPGPVPAA